MIEDSEREANIWSLIKTFFSFLVFFSASSVIFPGSCDIFCNHQFPDGGNKAIEQRNVEQSIVPAWSEFYKIISHFSVNEIPFEWVEVDKNIGDKEQDQ